MLALFIDDRLIIGLPNGSAAERRSLREEKFGMTDLGYASHILGIEVKHDKKAGTI